MSMALALVSFSILTLSAHRTVEQWSAEGVNPLTQVSRASRRSIAFGVRAGARARRSCARICRGPRAPLQEANRQNESTGLNEKAGDKATGDEAAGDETTGR